MMFEFSSILSTVDLYLATNLHMTNFLFLFSSF